jgi:hypothetical protein
MDVPHHSPPGEDGYTTWSETSWRRRTGRLLWQVTLPFAANTTPATYESGGMFIAYRLPAGVQRGRSAS